MNALPLPLVSAYVALGANLGNTKQTLQAATDELSNLPHTQLKACSRLFASAPVDASGPDFINAVVCLDTQLDAHILLQHLQQIERLHGRVRSYRNAARTLDLDLLLYGTQTIHTPKLTVPHPRMHERAFVLLPLADIAPQLHLAQGPIKQLLQQCHDQPIRPLDDPLICS